MKRSIYLDYNATTPLDAKVREAMLSVLDSAYGNPSSVHHVGRRARSLLDEAHERAATVFHCKPSEIVFTSGGTESNNLAILGSARKLKAKGKHLITSAIEHHAVLECFRRLESDEGYEVTYIKPDKDYYVSPNSVLYAMRPDTVLVSVMAVNNEVGAIQPIAEIGRLCQSKGVLFHTDAVQWFGKEPFIEIHQFNADLVSACAHKIHGPKGAGLLYVKSPFQLQNVQLGGPQENERRAGTENLPSITGLIVALEQFINPPVFRSNTTTDLSKYLKELLIKIDEVNVIDCCNLSLNTVAFTVKGTDSLAVLAGLDLEGICASAGAACATGALEPSHVLTAGGYSTEEAKSLIRFSLGRENTMEELEHLHKVLPGIIKRAITSV